MDRPRHAGAAPAHERVPVEHRLFGLDKRALLPAGIVLGVGLVWSIGLPLVNDAVAWDDPIVAGDAIDMGDGVSFVPPVGWQLTDGVRVSEAPVSGVSADSSAQVASGGVQIEATGGTFSGDATALMDQMTSNLDAEGSGVTITGGRGTLVTDSGLVGVGEPFTSTDGDGLVATFVLPNVKDSGPTPAPGPTPARETAGEAPASRAVTFVVRTAPGQYAANAADIDATLRSLTAGGSR
ncbi:hypothetical protein GCM10023094_18520 [Rhodococcus olei]|uniref:MspA protein n=1 Tax=Rhodococcus olei TaxID=2161675 RepID=A0ABP8P0L9_9NOCA